jgi:uncharacterized membrane protein YphA (DoxX/SURF4 family)
MKFSPIPILLLRLALGGLFLSLGWGKYQDGWLSTTEHLNKSLTGYLEHATGPQRVYLERVAMPLNDVWSRLITLGEFGLGVSLLLGFLTRLTTALGIFMVLNLHAATGNLFSLNFFESPWAALLIAVLLVLLICRAGRWAGVDQLLAKSNSSGIFW